MSDAKKEAAEVYQISKRPDETDNPVLAGAYEWGTNDGALAAILEVFRSDPKVAGAPYRMLDRAKPISVILGIATAAMALLLGRDFFTAIGIGIVVGVASIAIALAIYRQMVKPK